MASTSGSTGARLTISNQAKPNRPSTAGSSPSRDRPMPRCRRSSRRASRTGPRQGAIGRHRSPSTTEPSTSPTQIRFQITSGSRFSSGSRVPNTPTTSSAAKTANPAQLRPAPPSRQPASRRLPSRGAAPPSAPASAVSSTASPAASRNGPVGSVRITIRPEACASAIPGQSTTAAMPANRHCPLIRSPPPPSQPCHGGPRRPSAQTASAECRRSPRSHRIPRPARHPRPTSLALRHPRPACSRGPAGPEGKGPARRRSPLPRQQSRRAVTTVAHRSPSSPLTCQTSSPPMRLCTRAPRAIASTSTISSGRGPSGIATVIASKWLRT